MNNDVIPPCKCKHRCSDHHWVRRTHRGHCMIERCPCTKFRPMGDPIVKRDLGINNPYNRKMLYKRK